MAFPPRSLSSVRAGPRMPSCMGGFAPIEVDFEPLPDGVLGFEFVDAAEWSGHEDLLESDPELSECAQAAGHGVLAALVGDIRPDSHWLRPPPPFELRGLRSDEPSRARDREIAASKDLDIDLAALLAAVRRGHPLLGEEGRPPIAVAVLLRRAKYHLVDSFPAVFHKAGAAAAAEAVRRVRTAPAARETGAPAPPGPSKRR